MMICCGAMAQNTEAARRAAAIAEKQALDEKLSRLTSTMEGLVNDQLNLLKQIQSQAAEIRELRAEVARLKADQELQRKAAESAVTQAEFKSLVAQINQSESKRKKDQELILDSIEDIGKARIAAAQAAQSSSNNSSGSKSVKPDPQPSTSSVGYEYEVQPGDNISSIVASYRESGVPVTVNMVLRANPSVVPERLQVGTKLFIPDPREE
jgi:peptidoglycan hydrolase CwlO-like protein